jgi:A/G-specific adenine glycosylase
MEPGDQYPEAHDKAFQIFLDLFLQQYEEKGGILIGGEKHREIKKDCVPPYDPSKFPNKWRKIEPNKPVRTLTAHIGKDTYSHIHYDSNQARTISVREAARLQSFPDGFAFAGSMSSRFRQIGNAVPPLLCYRIAQEVATALGLSRSESLPSFGRSKPDTSQSRLTGPVIMNSRPEVLEENGHSITLSKLHDRLKSWGQENLRSFPWRRTRSPYRLLMAEFMLLRTQAKQVEPVYREFIERYPSLDELALASREDIRDILQPLGLSWRADRVFQAVQKLEEEHNLTVPLEKGDLLDLPGVSQYIAAAVRCFVLDKPEALVDTNTVRIAGRLFDLEIKESSRRTKKFQGLISELVDPSQPRHYNLSMLDLGAKICKSRSPSCGECPLMQMCSYGQKRLNSTH